ncbi:MAG: nucleotidyl transferase [Bacteroidetes bacterium]|nr:nucleotidyl transferase [Bacteroidota bacterium]
MKIIIPIAGEIYFDDSDYIYPKPIIDIDDKPIIEYVINNYLKIEEGITFCFILKETLCSEFNLDFTLKQLTSNPIIIKLKNETKGATCSVLMAIDEISMDEEIVIANYDQFFIENISKAISLFRDQRVDAGIITFNSVHPRWSFAIVDEQENVKETAERRPISKNAMTGFFYFKTFKTFIEGAFKSVINENYYDNKIYVASSINQLILKGKIVKAYKIHNHKFISFYTPQKIKEFERRILEEKLI